MSGDFTDDLEWGGCPNDFDNQWVDRLRDSVIGVVLTGWSPLQQKLGALLQVRLFKVEELEVNPTITFTQPHPLLSRW